jgi:phosphonate transport system permease protein
MSGVSPDLRSRFSGMSSINFVLILVVAAVVLSSINSVAPSVGQLADGLPSMINLLDRMWPPNTDANFLARVGMRLVETFQIALAGAAIGQQVARNNSTGECAYYQGRNSAGQAVYRTGPC